MSSSGDAVVIIADFTAIGDQVHSGWACLMSAAMPAMCGADIEVPDIELKLL